MTEDVKRIVEGLRDERCNGCLSGRWQICRKRANKEYCGKLEHVAADLIEQLTAELEQVRRERDAAVRDVMSLCATNYFSGDYCEYCKYNEPDG